MYLADGRQRRTAPASSPPRACRPCSPRVPERSWAPGRTAGLPATRWAGSSAGPGRADALFHPGNTPDTTTMLALFPDRGVAVATLVNAGNELPGAGQPLITDRITRNVVHCRARPAGPGSAVPVALLPGLRPCRSWRLLASATWALARSVRALSPARRRTRPSHPAKHGQGSCSEQAVPVSSSSSRSLTYGWRGLWTWAPDLAAGPRRADPALVIDSGATTCSACCPSAASSSPSLPNTERKRAHVLAGD